MNAELSRAQRKTLTAIEELTAKHGFPPTVNELADKLKRTKASVHGSLDRLIKAGAIRRTPGKARSIEVVRPHGTSVINLVPVPLLGDVPAGVPINLDATDNGHVNVQSDIVGKHTCFALNVVGDSMAGADIVDGDVLIVRQQPLAENNDVVVAAVDGEVTVKRLAIDDGCVYLLPENPDYEVIAITPDKELRILGRVIATHRVANKKF